MCELTLATQNCFCSISNLHNIREEYNLSLIHILIVYPNPAVSSFTVSLKNQTFDMEITDETGLNIYNATNIAEKTEINCENLAKGIYFIRAISDKGTVYSRKMIILK